MNTRQNKIIAALLLASASALPFAVHAATVDLSASGWVTYGDANSYALNTGGLAVQSAPGQIDAFIKSGLHSGGNLANGTAGMDDAFQTPTANNIEGFRTSSANEPGGVQGAWDRDGWWDSTLGSINSQLNLLTNSMVFFFANNETGNTPDLAAWGRVELTKISTNALLGRYDLTNDPSHQGLVSYGPPPLGGGVPFGDPTAYASNGAAPVVSDFVDSGNDVCVDGSGSLVSCLGPYAHKYSENLGGDHAAYAIVFPELDQKISQLLAQGADLSDYALHIDFRLGCGPELTADGLSSFPTNANGSCADNYALNGGEEKLFIGTQLASNVPEPASLLLTALGLLGIGALRRRQQQ